MAKQQNTNGNGNGNHESLGESLYSTPDVYTTSKGATVRFIGLNPQRLGKLQTAGKEPEVPYREYETDFGDKQKEPLSENDLQNDEERTKWAEYIAKRDALKNKRDENIFKYVFNDGFAVNEDEIEDWKRQEEEEWGLELSNSPIQLRIDFINAKVVGNAQDLAEIMAGVLERTGVPAESLDEVRNSFRSNLRRSTTPETAEE